MQKTQEMKVQALGWEDPLKQEMATDSSIPAWKIPWTEEPGGYSPRGRKESDTSEQARTETCVKGGSEPNRHLTKGYSRQT